MIKNYRIKPVPGACLNTPNTCFLVTVPPRRVIAYSKSRMSDERGNTDNNTLKLFILHPI